MLVISDDRCQARSETRGWGGPKFQNEIFRPWRELGGPNLEKVDKIYTRGENFSKKGHFDKIFGILPSWGDGPPAPPRYGPVGR